MKPKILGIQFRKNEASCEQERCSIMREVGADVVVDFVCILDESAPWSDPAAILAGYSGVVLGGSGDFDFDGGRSEDDPARTMSYEFLERLRPLFTHIFEHDIPTLGICYGHQLVGAFAGAQVRCDEVQKKSCSHDVKLLVDKNDYFLFTDLPDTFAAHYGHKDSLCAVPDGAILLMHGGDKCKVSALRYKSNIYTVQFHPELNFEDMVERIKLSPGYLPEGVAAEEIFKKDPESNRILQNFAKLVVAAAGEAAEVSVPHRVPDAVIDSTV